MRVLVDGKVFDSDDEPVMIMFSKEEILAFKKQPNHVDIHCSFPKSWGRTKGQKWMNDNKGYLIETNTVLSKVVSDDKIKELISKNSGENFLIAFEEDSGKKED